MAFLEGIIRQLLRLEESAETAWRAAERAEELGDPWEALLQYSVAQDYARQIANIEIQLDRLEKGI